MKKILMITLVFMLGLQISGCSKRTTADIKGENTAAQAETSSAAIGDDEIYQELDYLIQNPDEVEDTELQDTITFAAMILSEPEEVTYDDNGQTYLYQYASISRNMDDDFLLEVSSLAEPLPVDSMVSVTGVIAGFVYDVEDNEKVSELEIWADQVELMPESTVIPSNETEIKITAGSGLGNYSFHESHKSENVFGDVIILYFDYTNTGLESAYPDLSRLLFMQADTLLEPSIFDVTEVDPKALNASVPTPEVTLPGKTMRYYYVLSADNGVNEQPISIIRTDDYFNITNLIEIPVTSFGYIESQ